MEHCQKCNVESDELRTLWMECGYGMGELQIPFTHETITYHGVYSSPYQNILRDIYKLNVCKDCRSTWMTAIQDWWNKPVVNDSCGIGIVSTRGIFVRRNGANVEISEEEWNAMYPGIIPVRFKDE